MGDQTNVIHLMCPIHCHVAQQCQAIFDQLEFERQAERAHSKRLRKQQTAASKASKSNNLFGVLDCNNNHEQQQLEKRRRRRRQSEEVLPLLDHKYILELTDQLVKLNGVEISRQPHFHLERAFAHYYYAHRQFDRVQATISSIPADQIATKYHKEIELLWYNAEYQLAQIRRGCAIQMTPVNKYRIRMKNPCPTSEKKYNISLEARQELHKQFTSNSRPDRATRLLLSEKLGLTLETIGNWFKNRRQRVKKQGCLPDDQFKYSSRKGASRKLLVGSQASSVGCLDRSQVFENNNDDIISTTLHYIDDNNYSSGYGTLMEFGVFELEEDVERTFQELTRTEIFD